MTGEDALQTPSADFWEPLFAQSDDPGPRRPNIVFEQLLTTLPIQAGHAWDMTCGHGGDALWLASMGWTVTATDVSSTAVRRVLAAAKSAHLGHRVDSQCHDLTKTQPIGLFDLVYANYFHSPIEIDRAAIIRQAAARTPDGGYLVVIDHASSAPWSWERKDSSSFPAPEETLAGLQLGQEWGVIRCECIERIATGPDGVTTATVSDNVIVVQRARRETLEQS